MSVVKVGEHVWANIGGEDFIGHVQRGEEKNAAGEDKAVIQTPGGGGVELGYREPKGDSDRGMTFWIGDLRAKK